jgi:AcrR family transcriptional regulator
VASSHEGDDRAADPAGTAPHDADAAVVRGQEPSSIRTPLTQERIVDAAVEFIDDFGLPGLSMRRLGTRLGVEAMSLYRYVPGREQLLDAVVERIIDQMEADPDVLEGPEHGWQDYLQRLAHGIRRVALTHPKAFPLVASRPAEAPWLRPPLRSLRWVEAFLQGLAREGFSDQAAVEAYRAFTSFLLGHLLLEVAALGAVPECASADRPAERGPLRDRVRGLVGEPSSAAGPHPHRELDVAVHEARFGRPA